MHLKRKAPAEELQPKRRPQKNLTEAFINSCEERLREIPNKTTIRADKNIEEKEVAMSLTKINRKIYLPKSYDKTINDPIHGCHWRETIEKELQNMKSHQTQKYNELLPEQKEIGFKQIFKVMYYPDR